MPPKARASGRLAEKQNKKRKADEIEEDLSTNVDRPAKKAKIAPEKKGKSIKPEISTVLPESQNNNRNAKNNVEDNYSADQMVLDSGRSSRRAKKVAVSKIVTNTATEDPIKAAEDLVQKQRALQRLTTLKEQRQIAPRFEDEEYTLPDELILQIFSYLKRRDMYSVGLACRQWYRLSNDQSLGWHLALSLALREKMEVYTTYEGKDIFGS